MLRNAIEGRKAEKDWERPPKPAELGLLEPGEPPVRPPEPPAVQRLCFRIGVVGEARFLSHLETMNAWIRALRRARAPLAYSEGFHPHPKQAFSGARPVMEETLGDFMDILLNQRVDAAELLARRQATVLAGFKVLGVQELPLEATSLMSAVAGADYRLFVPGDAGTLGRSAAELMAAETIEVQCEKKQKRGRRGRRGDGKPFKIVDLCPSLEALTVLGEREGGVELSMRLATTDSGRGAKPAEIMDLLGADPVDCRVVRLQTRFHDEQLAPLVLSGRRAAGAVDTAAPDVGEARLLQAGAT